MFDSSSTELIQMDRQLDPILCRAKDQAAETEQLALDATRLLSCTEGRLQDYQGKGFFKRCWFTLSGKTGALERANQSDLIQMQKLGWRYIGLLQERNLMTAHSIITIKNNLLTLAIQEEGTRKAIAQMADRIYDRFRTLENRVGELEVAVQIHNWLLTLEACDYDEKYPPHVRLLRIVRDFHTMKGDNWNLQEIKFLQTAISKVGLEAKKTLTLQVFVDELIDEMERVTFDQYSKLVCLPQNGNDEMIPAAFILRNIAVPSYTALYRIQEDYPGILATVAVLAEADQLKTSPKEALKKTLLTFVQREGIDTNVAIPLRDLAIELLTCMSLTSRLYQSSLPQTKDQRRSDEAHGSAAPVTAGNLVALQKQAAKGLSAYAQLMGQSCASKILDELSTYIDQYNEDEDMELDAIAAYFRVDNCSSMLLSGLKKATNDLGALNTAYSPGVGKRLGKELELLFPTIVEPFMKKVAKVQGRGCAVSDTSQSTDPITDGVQDFLSGMTFGIIEESHSVDDLTKRGEALDRAVASMIQTYNAMQEHLTTQVTHLFTKVYKDNIKQLASQGNVGALEQLSEAISDASKG